MSKVLELFGKSAKDSKIDWKSCVDEQNCPFINKTCYKVRKSNPDISIGTCTVSYGKKNDAILICPARLLDKNSIFRDCLHLLMTHEPGNELHIVQEVSIPGGSVDFFLVSALKGKIKDFVGIELQTLDTTGTVWPERQKLLKDLNVIDNLDGVSNKGFGMNWKMTAKTILVQMHHKIETFEHVNKKIVLIIQDKLLEYMNKEFNFGHLKNPASIGDSLHFHAYSITENFNSNFNLELNQRLSTDSDGISQCLGLRIEAKVKLEQILSALESKISEQTLFSPI